MYLLPGISPREFHPLPSTITAQIHTRTHTATCNARTHADTYTQQYTHLDGVSFCAAAIKFQFQF
jgi:hypothetical protein